MSAEFVLELLSRRPEWHDRAACRGLDPELFFAGRGEIEETKAAKRVCAGCPVRSECLDYALDSGEKHGVWGGAAEKERRRMRGQRQRFCSCGQPVRSPHASYCAACSTERQRQNHVARTRAWRERAGVGV